MNAIQAQLFGGGTAGQLNVDAGSYNRIQILMLVSVVSHQQTVRLLKNIQERQLFF